MRSRRPKIGSPSNEQRMPNFVRRLNVAEANEFVSTYNCTLNSLILNTLRNTVNTRPADRPTSHIDPRKRFYVRHKQIVGFAQVRTVSQPRPRAPLAPATSRSTLQYRWQFTAVQPRSDGCWMDRCRPLTCPPCSGCKRMAGAGTLVYAVASTTRGGLPYTQRHPLLILQGRTKDARADPPTSVRRIVRCLPLPSWAGVAALGTTSWGSAIRIQTWPRLPLSSIDC